MNGIRKFPYQQIDVNEKRLISQIGDNIYYFRKKKKMSVRMLALTAGVEERYLYRIENGEHCASIATIYRIAKALEMDINDLIGEIGNEEI
ncbi:MAG: helix-turn-helix transcriptional regulator [Lachnospiraceae bacterium]|nr:helix-turn-helix transcriptional regulator [Lachnospiraceae bacterium]